MTRRRQFNGNRNDGWQRPSARTENSLQRAGDCRQPWSALRRTSWLNRAQNGWWTHPTNRPTPTWIPCTTNPTADGSVVTWRSPWSWQTGKCRPTFPPHRAPQPIKSRVAKSPQHGEPTCCSRLSSVVKWNLQLGKIWTSCGRRCSAGFALCRPIECSPGLPPC